MPRLFPLFQTNYPSPQDPAFQADISPKPGCSQSGIASRQLGGEAQLLDLKGFSVVLAAGGGSTNRGREGTPVCLSV